MKARNPTEGSLLCVFIAVLVQYFLQAHPYLKRSFAKTFAPSFLYTFVRNHN